MRVLYGHAHMRAVAKRTAIRRRCANMCGARMRALRLSAWTVRFRFISCAHTCSCCCLSDRATVWLMRFGGVCLGSCNKVYHQRGHMLRHYASKHLNKRHACDAAGCTRMVRALCSWLRVVVRDSSFLQYAHADNLRRHKQRDHKELLENGVLSLASNVRLFCATAAF